MKYDWDGTTGEKPARKFTAFPMALAICAFVAVVVYLFVGSPGMP